MVQRPKILVVDDDPDALELYQERLAQLPSQPKVSTAISGAQAVSLLESENFTLLLSDLNMPLMNGLDVLALVRRKYPQMRTAVMTSVTDPQFRTRAYAMGLDLYLEKPITKQAIQVFLDCIEALLGQESHVGFRGMQSKSLVDIIQLECLSQSSAVLRISNGFCEGQIWFQNGEVIDAATEGLAGESAFRLILSWRTGNFEILPEEPNHPRSIFTSSQGLLLETAQAIDENLARAESGHSALQPTDKESVVSESVTSFSKVEEMGRHPGVEFVMTMVSPDQPPQCWAVENPQSLAIWVGQTLDGFRNLGDEMGLGRSFDLLALGLQRHVAMSSGPSAQLCVGFERSQTKTEMRQTMHELKTKWAS
jgi:CheY-like chemotaxis protein